MCQNLWPLYDHKITINGDVWNVWNIVTDADTGGVAVWEVIMGCTYESHGPMKASCKLTNKTEFMHSIEIKAIEGNWTVQGDMHQAEQ